MSDVTGFEESGNKFIEMVKQRGCTLKKVHEVFPAVNGIDSRETINIPSWLLAASIGALVAGIASIALNMQK